MARISKQQNRHKEAIVVSEGARTYIRKTTRYFVMEPERARERERETFPVSRGLAPEKLVAYSREREGGGGGERVTRRAFMPRVYV